MNSAEFIHSFRVTAIELVWGKEDLLTTVNCC